MDTGKDMGTGMGTGTGTGMGTGLGTGMGLGTVKSMGKVNLQWSRALVDALVVGGVRHACVSPGSRSSPLAVAVTEREGTELTVSVHVDERSAGYFAVGYARASGRPAMLVCTSGTAAANYLPAVVEACHSRVPLVVITADRPPELRDSGSWQTIDQVKLYGGFVRWFADMAVPSDDPAMQRYARDMGRRAATVAAGPPGGAVHLNVPFGEPLLPDSGQGTGDDDVGRRDDVRDGAPGGRAPRPLSVLPEDELDGIAAELAGRPRGLILAGQLNPMPGYAEAVAHLAAATGYPILAEPLGGLRFGPHDRSHVVSRYEALLRSSRWAERHAPEVVIRFGASFVWRQVTDYLAEFGDALRLVVDPEHTWDDPTRLPSTRLAVDPVPLCDALVRRLEELAGANAGWRADRAAWLQEWRAADAAADEVMAGMLTAGGGPNSNTAWVHRAVTELAPRHALLFAANSMAVRDLDSFAPSIAARLRAVANRGAAGIDGTISSALGAAYGSGAPTILLTGDLAFAHDLNGLSAVGLDGLDVTVVVLNDGGGGIFDYLPAALLDSDVFERCFTTPSGLDIAAACRAYGVPYTEAAGESSIAEAIRSGRGVSVIEVPIDRTTNTKWHRGYWDGVGAALTPRHVRKTV